MHRIESQLKRKLILLVLITEFFLRGIQAFVLGTIHVQPNDDQDFLINIICFDIHSKEDCCQGARHALENFSLKLVEDCVQHLSLIPTHAQRTMHSLSFQSKHVHATGWISPQDGIVAGKTSSFLWDDQHSKMITQNVSLVEAVAHLSPEESNNLSIPICLESSLSGSGMHREIHYKIHTDQDLQSLDVLIHLPADIFINKEDVIAHSRNTHFIESITSEPIDLEEPTFVSPPHALVMRFGATKQDASFSVKLHLRYPKPLEIGDFRRIMLPPALEISALTIVDQKISVMADNSCAYPIEIWAASGHVDDSWLTLLCTVGFALIGAAVMLRDLSRVTVWR